MASGMMAGRHGAAPVMTIMGIAIASVLMVSCENSDPTAPEGATITVSANPQTVRSGVTARITATVRSANGTRLPDQEVVFTTTTGSLSPPAQTPILTDDDGQAETVLSTTQTATVMAASGGRADPKLVRETLLGLIREDSPDSEGSSDNPDNPDNTGS